MTLNRWIAALLLSGAPLFSQVLFAPRADYSDITGATASTVADFNNDGHADIAVRSRHFSVPADSEFEPARYILQPGRGGEHRHGEHGHSRGLRGLQRRRQPGLGGVHHWWRILLPWKWERHI